MVRTNINAKLMKQAGFKHLYFMGTEIWRRGDLRIAVGPRRLTLNKLIGSIINQAVYRDRAKTRIVHEGFKTTNES